MNRPAFPVWVLLAALPGGALCSCRTKPPVVRQFLRMPAEYAGGLTTIERARWVKEWRAGDKSPQAPPYGHTPKDGVMHLPSHSTNYGTVMQSLQLLHAPGPDKTSGGLAVITDTGNATRRIRLVEYRPSGYTEVTDRFPSANARAVSGWFLDGKNRCATGFVYVRKGPDSLIGSSGSADPRLEFVWNGQTWVQRAPQSGGWRVVTSRSPAAR